MCVIIIMVNSMNSRMERYKSENTEDSYSENSRPVSRVSRNNSLYQDIKSNELSRVRHNDNIRVIENSGKTIDLEKIKRYVSEINEQPRAVRRSVSTKFEDETTSVVNEEDLTPKDYDINSVLEKAKKTREIDYDRERYKKLRDTQYDILSKIDMYDEVKDEEEVPGMKDYQEDFNTDERTLIDLINTVTIHKGDFNLLDELMGGEDEETTDPIEKELEKADINKDIKESVEKEEKVVPEINETQVLSSLKKDEKVDNSFYTSSMSFSKDDFEGFDELEKSVKKNGIFTTIIVVLIVVVIIVSLVVILNYVLKLGLF